MKARNIVCCLGILLLPFVLACPPGGDDGGGPTDPPDDTASLPQVCLPATECTGSQCAVSIGADQATIPVTSCTVHGEGQNYIDIYSWNTFIALNWPADTSSCAADTNRSIGDLEGKRVWETYLRNTDVFAASGPAAWCAAELAASLEPPEMFAISKVTDSFDEVLEAFNQGPLVDQNGRWVRYEIRVNEDEYNYITSNELYLKSGQVGFTVKFPDGSGQTVCKDGSGQAVSCGDIGSIELKAAWKVLSGAEIASGRFYTTQGTVYNDAGGDPSPGQNPVTLGLVGLHIVHKTEQNGDVWSTFEQVDNTTTSFFDAACTDCEVNTQTVPKPYNTAKELAADGTPLQKPAQVVRETPIEQYAAELNTYYQGLLAGTVWEHYQLIASQWGTGTLSSGTPEFVANTTLETFFQKTTNTCMGCHKGATTTYCPDGQCTSADNSFLLGAAY